MSPEAHGVSTRQETLRDFLQGDGVAPARLFGALNELGNLELPLRFQWGFVYLDEGAKPEEIAKLRKRAGL